MIFAQNFARNYEKKMILGTWDAWSICHLSQQPSNAAYYIEDCPILKASYTKTQVVFEVINIFFSTVLDPLP